MVITEIAEAVHNAEREGKKIALQEYNVDIITKKFEGIYNE